MSGPNFELSIPDSSVDWYFVSARAVESIHAPWSFDIVCRPVDDDYNAAKLVAEVITLRATLTWRTDGDDRALEAVVDDVEARERQFTIRLVPRVALLADVIDHNVFVDEDAIAIAEKILGEHDITIENQCIRELPKRAQTVQAFESELEFVSRILADEGVAWFCHPTDIDKLVLCDHPDGFHEFGGDPLVLLEPGGMKTGTSLLSASLTQRISPEKVTLRDYNFETPDLDLEVDESVGDGVLEQYEYRGHYPDKGLGKTLAAIRLEEFRQQHHVLTCETSHRGLFPGAMVELEGRDDIADTWLIVSLEHDVRERTTESVLRPYTARFRAVLAADGYRPKRATEPSLGGVQTLDVCSGGGEIEPDEFGRVRAKFRWDRVHPKDDTASNWFRVTQPPLSGSYLGPRVGWEVLSSFWGCSGDDPIQLGRLYTGTDMPPSGLPGNKVVSAFGSSSTPGGGSKNLVEFNDTAGGESMNFIASKDYNERSENDKVCNITTNEERTVGNNRTLIVGQVHNVKVNNQQTYTVGSNRTINTKADKTITATTEIIKVGGARIFDIAGDQATECTSLIRAIALAKTVGAIEQQQTSVTGLSTRTIGVAWGQKSGKQAGVDVTGLHKIEVGGAKNVSAPKFGLSISRGKLSETYASKSIKAGGDINTKAMMDMELKVAGNADLKGANVVFVAKAKIVLKAQGTKITIKASGITVDAKVDNKKASVDKNDEKYD